MSLEKRNLTTHTYDSSNAAEVYSVIDRFSQDAQTLLNTLKARHD